MKITRINVTDQVVEYLKKNINEGNWRIGDKIPSENRMTAELGVSRASVRSALHQLAGLGIVESRHGKGTYVLKDYADSQALEDEIITAQDCRDMSKVLEFRCILETETCRLATEHCTEELLQELQNTLLEMRELGGSNSERFVAEDMRFHELIAEASQNPLIEKTLHRVFAETLRNHRQMYKIFGHENGISYHEKILECMEQRDAAGAAMHMHNHMWTALDVVKKDTGRY
ncbi:MAG: FadR/GntR family transcriptional regulator [Stomatobaculum sp.]